ncbi:DUF2977 domain-containing protein [Dellaglioa sp. L3N]
MIKISLNHLNEVINFAKIGDIENSIEYVGVIPDDFEVKFKPSFFMLENDVIIGNPDYKEPVIEEPSKVPTKTDKTIAQLMLQQAQQKLAQDKFNAQMLLEIAKSKENTNV